MPLLHDPPDFCPDVLEGGPVVGAVGPAAHHEVEEGLGAVPAGRYHGPQRGALVGLDAAHHL